MFKQLLFWLSIASNCLFGFYSMWSFGTTSGAILTFAMCLGYSCAFSLTEDVVSTCDELVASFAYSFIISVNVLIWVVAVACWHYYSTGQVAISSFTFQIILVLFVSLLLAQIMPSEAPPP